MSARGNVEVASKDFAASSSYMCFVQNVNDNTMNTEMHPRLSPQRSHPPTRDCLGLGLNRRTDLTRRPGTEEMRWPEEPCVSSFRDARAFSVDNKQFEYSLESARSQIKFL
jgi:hypothetical protein